MNDHPAIDYPGHEKGRLNVLVVGGLGGVGEGILEGLFAAAPILRRIVVSSRDREQIDAFRARKPHPKVELIVGSVDTSEHALLLRDAALANGPLDVVIASLGGWWEGPPLTGIDDATWRDTMNTLLTTHAVSARTFVPVVENSSCGKYLLIGGGAALRPVRGSSLVSIAGAAQAMLTRALVAERAENSLPLIAELIVDGPVATNRTHHGPVTPGEITAYEVGKAIGSWATSDSRRPSFDWLPALLSSDGPLTVMRPRPRDLGARQLSDEEVRAIAEDVFADRQRRETLGDYGDRESLNADKTALTPFGEARQAEYDRSWAFRILTKERPGDAWAVVRVLLELDVPGRYFPVVAAGEIEDLLRHNGPAIIDEVEADAASDPRIATALGGVWNARIEPKVWERIEAAKDRRGWNDETEPADHWWIAERNKGHHRP